MYLKELRIEGFKSFAKSAVLSFPANITGIVGPNGSGKSNVTEAFRFVLGEQSMKSMRGRRGGDLIFNGGTGASRANRAKVSIVFDNADNTLNSPFTDVSVSRTVCRDGTNEYTINDTQVRHRDVVELLAKANIGSTGHHIISQGEADRILHASNEERKEMLEDGLGLKLLQYRRAEAEKKLQRARANIAETDIIVRETTPHLHHLKRQVEQYEKAKKIQKDLMQLYATYLAHETAYIAMTKCATEEAYSTTKEKINTMIESITRERKKAVPVQKAEEAHKQEEALESALRAVRNKKDALSREIGRLEGEYAALESVTKDTKNETIDRKTLMRLYKDLQHRFMATDEYKTIIRYALEQLQAILGNRSTQQEAEKRLTTLKRREKKVQEEMSALQEEEQQQVCALEILRKEKEQKVADTRQSEKKVLMLVTEKNTLEQKLAEIRHARGILQEDEENMQREVDEGAALIGDAIHNYKTVIIPQETQSDDRTKQKERRRALERKKIELETIGMGGNAEETYAAYQEVSERIAFLQKEKKDLVLSMKNCEKGIERIQKEVDTRFKAGIQAISNEFEAFFRILFGGGKAAVAIEKQTIAEKEGEEAEVRIGVAVQIALPHKKVNTLEQLSGGERALVSIALLFAISQVTPPPFLVLDETDAALDEANSKRYGDMIESLAERSQLILITHNRETMHRAGVLYGVTMGTGGISTLLSVQFDEAVSVAK